MKLFFFQALLWILTGGLYVRSNAELTAQQTFSTPHGEVAVTVDEAVRLTEIDACNPLFIFK